MKQSSLSTNFRIEEPFNLDYVIHFYIYEKGLSSPVCTIKVLMAEMFGFRQIIRVLPGNLPRVNECATMPSVNNMTNSTYAN